MHLYIHRFAFWLLLANSVLRCAVETTWWGYYHQPHQVAFQQTHNYNTTQAKTKTQIQPVWWGILLPASSGSFSTYTQTKHNTSKDKNAKTKNTNTNTNCMMGNTIASLIRWHFSAAVHSYTVRWRRLWAFWWISSQGPTTIFLTEDRSLNTQCICQSADGATWYTVPGPSYKYWNRVKKERMYEAEQDSAFEFFSSTKECFGDFHADESQQLKYYFPPLTINNLWQCSMPSLGSPHCPIFTWDS